MAFKFAVHKSSLATGDVNSGIVQHVRTLSKKETYNHLANKTGYPSAKIKGVFKAFAVVVKDNADKACSTTVDNAVAIRTTVKGAFEGSTGPWAKSKNWLQLNATTLDPFRSAAAGITPTNNTTGAKPVINTVLNTDTGVYDVLIKGNTITIAGTDLAPDSAEADEYVQFIDKAGNKFNATIESSALDAVTVKFETAPTSANMGSGTLVIHTRCGLGTEYGVKEATRIVTFAEA